VIPSLSTAKQCVIFTQFEVSHSRVSGLANRIGFLELLSAILPRRWKASKPTVNRACSAEHSLGVELRYASMTIADTTRP
jgi:hypothetical protein